MAANVGFHQAASNSTTVFLVNNNAGVSVVPPRHVFLSERNNDSFLALESSSLFQSLSPSKYRELVAWMTATLLLCYFGALANLLVLWVTWPMRRPAARNSSGVSLLIFHFTAANLIMCVPNNVIMVVMIQV